MFLLFRHVTKCSRSSFSSFPKLLSTGTKGTKTKKPKPKFASDFNQDDAQLLKVSFQPASFEDVIPSLKGSGTLFRIFILAKHWHFKYCAITAPAEYLLPEINRHIVGNPDFQIDKLDKVSNQVKTFIDKMRDVVENEKVAVGTDESKTDTLVDDLLRIANLNVWPLKILWVIIKMYFLWVT